MRATGLDDTIVAIATPLGEGGIGIVRISGPRALEIAGRLFRSSTGRDPLADSERVYHGHIVDGEEPVDEVLLHTMRAPRSFTREDVAEINCHGGAGPLNAVLELALRAGARLAEPGEFTRRAFLNGRIDLVQAEAVIDVIRAKTRAALRAASAASQGALSRAIHDMRDTLAHALARVEAAVDFPEDDLPELVDDAMRAELKAVRARMGRLLKTADAGRLLREGAAVAIAGRPNVGKSSLFNALLRDARAIVTEQPGTTRDRIEETINIAGVPVRLTDTAGMRHTEDRVERIGVDIARDSLRQADAVLFVLDASREPLAEDRDLARELAEMETPVIAVLNKMDLGAVQDVPPPPLQPARTCRMCAETGDGLAGLEAAMSDILLHSVHVAPEQGIVTRLHQRDSLRRAEATVAGLLDHFDASPEFLSLDLREALAALGEITGETTTESLLDTIFASFCIGK